MGNKAKLSSENKVKAQVEGHQTGMEKFFHILQDPVKKMSEWAVKIPGIDTTVEKIQNSVLDFFLDFSKWDIKQEEAVRNYRTAGHKQVKSTQDIISLDLSEIEEVIGGLCQKYKTLAQEDKPSEGAVALPGMPSDIIALVHLNHSAISEYATHYGFDITNREERIFALSILEYAASTNENTKKEIMQGLMGKAKQMADKSNIGYFNKDTFKDLLSVMVNKITIELLKAKIGQTVPINGAVIDSGFNAYFTTEVCDIANFFYKQRFLAGKYGAHLLDLAPDTKLLDHIDPAERPGENNNGTEK